MKIIYRKYLSNSLYILYSSYSFNVHMCPRLLGEILKSSPRAISGLLFDCSRTWAFTDASSQCCIICFYIVLLFLCNLSLPLVHILCTWEFFQISIKFYYLSKKNLDLKMHFCLWLLKSLVKNANIFTWDFLNIGKVHQKKKEEKSNGIVPWFAW